MTRPTFPFSFWKPKPFNPLLAPSGNAPVIDWDADHLTQIAGTVTALPNQGSFGAAGNALFFGGSQNPTFTAINAAFNNKPTFDYKNGGLQRNSLASFGGITTGARSWIFVLSSDDVAGTISPFIFADGAFGCEFVFNTVANSGKITVTGNGLLGSIVTALFPNATPVVLIITWSAAGSCKIYISALTAVATGAVVVPDETGTGFTMPDAGGLGRLTGSVRFFQLWSVDLTATGDVPYFLNGFGADSGITIGA